MDYLRRNSHIQSLNLAHGVSSSLAKARLFLSLSSSCRYILFGSAPERKLVRGGRHSFSRFGRWSSAPWRDGTSELIRATKCLDLTGQRTDAVESQQLGGTIRQARAAVAALSFVLQVIE
jgi:hypothetical protein